MATNNLQSLIYSNEDGIGPKLSVLDQLLVPNEKVYIDILDVEGAWAVIRSMQIRGMNTLIASFESFFILELSYLRMFHPY